MPCIITGGAHREVQGYYIAYRHLSSANFIFADGHIENRNYFRTPLHYSDYFFWFFCTLCKKWEWNIRNPCAVKPQSGIIGRDAPFYSV